MTNRDFIEACYELAYGDTEMAYRTLPIPRYDYEAGLEGVLKVLRDHSDKSFAWETMLEEHQPNDDDEDTQEDYDLREKMETYLRSCESEHK